MYKIHNISNNIFTIKTSRDIKAAVKGKTVFTLYFIKKIWGFAAAHFFEFASSCHYRKNSLKQFHTDVSTDVLCLQHAKVVGNYAARFFHSLFFHVRQLKFLSAV